MVFSGEYSKGGDDILLSGSWSGNFVVSRKATMAIVAIAATCRIIIFKIYNKFSAKDVQSD